MVLYGRPGRVSVASKWDDDILTWSATSNCPKYMGFLVLDAIDRIRQEIDGARSVKVLGSIRRQATLYVVKRPTIQGLVFHTRSFNDRRGLSDVRWDGNVALFASVVMNFA